MIWPHLGMGVARHADHSSGVHVDLGDLPTWLLAVFAFLALLAAVAAYRKQSSSDDHLAEQVRLQGKALKDQQAVNALQAKVLERTLGALTRQQAEQIDVEYEWRDAMQADGLASPSGTYWLVRLRNDSPRPVRCIACQLPAEYEQADFKAAEFVPITEETDFGLVDEKVIHVLASRETWGFVVAIPLETPQKSPWPTVRFTDDAGQRWQVTDDKSIAPADDGDW